MISIEGFNYCKKLGKPIDDVLVNEIEPPCIDKNNGCGNCSNIGYRNDVNV